MLDSLIFEQPVHEQARIYLKLEHLFHQIEISLKKETVDASRQGVEAVAHALTLLDRSDFKSKLVKELHRISNVMTRLANSDMIDHRKLSATLNELNQLLNLVHSTEGKFGQELREHEFLTNIRQQLQSPGGLCGFELPSFHLWLHQSANARQNDLKNWYEGFDTLRQSLTLLLKIYRESTLPQNRIAEGGHYQMSLDPQASVHILRIYLPKQTTLYPEVSIGRHGMSLRFGQLDNQSKKRKLVEKDVVFKISVCAI